MAIVQTIRFCIMNNEALNICMGGGYTRNNWSLNVCMTVLHVCKKGLKLVHGVFARVQKGIEVSSRGFARVQKGLEVSSRGFASCTKGY